MEREEGYTDLGSVNARCSISSNASGCVERGRGRQEVCACGEELHRGGVNQYMLEVGGAE
jgi:hypothetical protein